MTHVSTGFESQTGRRETALERVDRNLSELMSELRVLATGVQVLFAFLLTLPFSAGFERVSQLQRYAYFAVLLSTAASSALLLAPAVLHRLIFRHGDKPYLVNRANQLALMGVGLLAVSMAGILTLLADNLFGVVMGWLTGAFAVLMFGGLWFGMGLGRRRQVQRRLVEQPFGPVGAERDIEGGRR